MNIELLQQLLKEKNQPSYRAKQISKAVYGGDALRFSEISSIPKLLGQQLDEAMRILSFSVVKINQAKDKRSIKALLELTDGMFIETVLIAPKPGSWSACLSSQVGCPLGCGFCATGRMGFRRNLNAEEIADQVLFWRQHLKANNLEGNFSNIVYMGMGEPFLNWTEVKASLDLLMGKDFLGFGARSISISTAGIPDGISLLAENFPQINLAISLHFSSDEKRTQWMPINKKYPLGRLTDALREYFKKTNRKVFLEYILLAGINDTKDDAAMLEKFIKSSGKPRLLHVNLIRYNEIGKTIKPSSKNAAVRFRDMLQQRGVGVTIRKSLGEDIEGACGQLATQKASD